MRKGYGLFIVKAKALNMTPRQYAEYLKKKHGTVFQAAMNTGFYPNTLYYHLNKKEQTA